VELDSDQTAHELDRCWQATQQLSRVAQYPDRSGWWPVLSIAGPNSNVIAMRTPDSKPLFCETTRTGVSLSNPDVQTRYAPGTQTGSVFVSDIGTVAGVVDPAWDQVLVEVTSRDKDSFSGPATLKDGLFVFTSRVSTLDGTITVRASDRNPRLPLPYPAALYGTADPLPIPADRTSAAGKLLGECLGRAQGVIDAATWQADAVVEANDERLIMATNTAGTSACYQQPQRTVFMPYLSRTVPTHGPELLPVISSVGGEPVIAGLLPSGGFRMQLTLADNTVLNSVTKNHAFAILLPPNVGTLQTINCKVFGQDNKELYAGPLLVG
jgi:hypothetical protein